MLRTPHTFLQNAALTRPRPCLRILSRALCWDCTCGLSLPQQFQVFISVLNLHSLFLIPHNQYTILPSNMPKKPITGICVFIQMLFKFHLRIASIGSYYLLSRKTHSVVLYSFSLALLSSLSMAPSSDKMNLLEFRLASLIYCPRCAATGVILTTMLSLKPPGGSLTFRIQFDCLVTAKEESSLSGPAHQDSGTHTLGQSTRSHL